MHWTSFRENNVMLKGIWNSCVVDYDNGSSMIIQKRKLTEVFRLTDMLYFRQTIP